MSIDYLGTLQDDWNGYGARSVTADSLKYAKLFVDKLLLNYAMPDAVSLDDGGVVLQWSSEGLLLSFDNDRIHMSHRGKTISDNLYLDDIPFDGQSIPDVIVTELTNLLSDTNDAMELNK
jgi:hypothetical protein